MNVEYVCANLDGWFPNWNGAAIQPSSKFPNLYSKLGADSVQVGFLSDVYVKSNWLIMSKLIPIWNCLCVWRLHVLFQFGS